MKSIRSAGVVVLLLTTSIFPRPADCFKENQVPIIVGATVIAVPGSIGLGVKLYYDWKKRTAKKYYESAIQIMQKIIVDQFSGEWAILDGVITQKHLDYFHPINHNALKGFGVDNVEIYLKNARMKNGKKYYPQLDQKAEELYGSFKEMSVKFERTCQLLTYFDSHLTKLNAIIHDIKMILDYSQRLQQMPNPLNSFVATNSWWLVDVHTEVFGYYSKLTKDIILAEMLLVYLADYNHPINLLTHKETLRNAKEAQHFLSTLMEQIRNNSSYNRQVELFEQFKHPGCTLEKM